MVVCGENFLPKCAESVTLAADFPTIFLMKYSRISLV